jgi:GPH family glycoside/pentoside/hexuronide:cation symporter
MSELPAPSMLASAADTRADKLPLPSKVSYAAGQLVELVVGSMLNVFVLFYVTAVCGLPGWLAGIALGAGLVVDAAMEPLIGSLTDGWRSRYGRRVPFMIAGLVPIVVTFNLIFALPTGMGDTALFLWLMLLSVSLRISLSIYTLPYQALGAELSDDYAERSSIAAWRWGIGILGTVAVIALGYGVFLEGPDGLSHRASYLPLTLSLSLILVAGALIAIRTGLVTRHRQHETVAPSAAIHVRLLGEVVEVFRNRTFRILFASMLLFNISAGVSQALGLHLGTFFWRLSSDQLQALALTAVMGLALGAPLAGPLGSRIEKRTMLVIGKSGMFICNAAPVTLKLLGLLTLTGSSLTAFLASVAFLNGAAMGLSIIAFLSIVADAADEHEYLFHTRREGLYFAGWSFAAKSATGAGLLIAGVVLQLIDFPTNLAEQGAAATTLPEHTVRWLGIAGGPGGALLSIVAIAMILLYRLDKGTHAQILAELNARRVSNAIPGSAPS